MKKILLLSALLSCNVLAAEPSAPPAQAPAKPPIAVVNGVAVPAVYANFVRQGRLSRGANPEALTEESIRDALITVELLSQEAAHKGLDKNALVMAALEYQRKDILAQAAIDQYLGRNPIGEEVIKAEYDKAKAQAGGDEYRVRHILVGSEKEAKDLITRLTTGKKTKFEDEAKKLSKDASAGNGGDLGWVLPANLVPEFANAMTKLKKGQISSAPVKTQFGWHVIRLDDMRTLDFPTFDKLKGQIVRQMQQQQLRRFVQELRATAKVE